MQAETFDDGDYVYSETSGEYGVVKLLPFEAAGQTFYTVFTKRRGNLTFPAETLHLVQRAR